MYTIAILIINFCFLIFFFFIIIILTIFFFPIFFSCVLVLFFLIYVWTSVLILFSLFLTNFIVELFPYWYFYCTNFESVVFICCSVLWSFILFFFLGVVVRNCLNCKYGTTALVRGTVISTTMIVCRNHFFG